MVESNLGRWTVAAFLALAAVPVFWLPVLMGEDVIGWPTTLAADALLALALVIVMRDARRRTFGWMAGLARSRLWWRWWCTTWSTQSRAWRNQRS